MRTTKTMIGPANGKCVILNASIENGTLATQPARARQYPVGLT